MIHVYNSTDETVKLCLLDTKNYETNTVLLSKEIWNHKTEDGWNTIVIIPLNANQNTFSYTLPSEHSVIIERKVGKLILVPSVIDSPRSKCDTTIIGHECIRSAPRHPAYTAGPCESVGCIVFNESNENIIVCITDYNDRNSHILLNQGEHQLVRTPRHPSVLKCLFMSPDSCLTTIRITILNMDKYIEDGESVALAKYPLTARLHNLGSSGSSEKTFYNFVRVIKKDEHFTIEQDVVYPYHGVPYSYLLTKECCEKIKKINYRYEIVSLSDNQYDVVALENKNNCSMM